MSKTQSAYHLLLSTAAAASARTAAEQNQGLLEQLGPLLIRRCYPKSHKTIHLVVNVLRVYSVVPFITKGTISKHSKHQRVEHNPAAFESGAPLSALRLNHAIENTFKHSSFILLSYVVAQQGDSLTDHCSSREQSKPDIPYSMCRKRESLNESPTQKS